MDSLEKPHNINKFTALEMNNDFNDKNDIGFATQEQAVSKAIDNLNKPFNINLSTDLSMNEIKNMVIMESVGEFYNSSVRRLICRIYKEQKVSCDRKSRKENIDIVEAQGRASFTQNNGGLMSTLGNVFGRR